MPRLLYITIVCTYFLSSVTTSHHRKTTYDNDVFIHTKSGVVRGCVKDLDDCKKVKQFFGIPYAKPPVGELRWKAPEPVEPWSKTHDGCKLYPPRCPQPILPSYIVEARGPTNEDCLILNIFTPKDATPSTKLSVMVWIHGGGFVVGSGNDQDGSYLASYNDVIVVTINYRLGVLGFMPFLGTSSKGNYGLLDMIASLTWIKDNIGSFGGNADDMTIFGQSAGGASVSILTLSPLAKDLFHRAVSESGVINMPWAVGVVTNKKQIVDFTTVLGCAGDMEVILECMRSKTTAEIMQAQKSAITLPNAQNDLLKPNVDGEVIPDLPLELLKTGNINVKDVIIGLTRNEGATFVPTEMSNPQNKLEDKVNRSLPLNIKNREAVRLAIVNRYSLVNRKKSHLQAWRKAISDFISDGMGDCSAYKSAQIVASTGKRTFVYLFAHRNRNSLLPEWSDVAHGEDIAYVFGAPFNVSASAYRTANNFTDMERGLSLAIMKMWSNFAKTGNPSIPDDGIDWPQFTSDSLEYLELKFNPEVKKNFKPEAMAFWNDYIPKLEETASQVQNG